MPAPLARGLIISLSLLIAAGVAVYENPQVREWIEANRRKLAQAMGAAAPAPAARTLRTDDVSIREDDGAEAVERRRIARQQIVERARLAREWAAARQHRRGASFDDMLDAEGNWRASGGGQASGAEARDATGLRHRPDPASFASAAAVQSFNSGFDEDEALELATRASTATLESPRPEALSINTDLSGDEVLELTPTTSHAPSSWHPNVFTPRTPPVLTPDALSFAGTPPIVIPDSLGTPRSPVAPMAPVALDPATLDAAFRSIHDWARTSTASFYSPPDSAGTRSPAPPVERNLADVLSQPSDSGSQAPSLVDLDDGRSESAADALSDFGGSAITPGTWTEVGSVVSDEEHR